MHGYYKFEPHSYGLVPRGQGGASEPARKRAAVSPLGNEGILPTMSTTRLKDPSSYSMEAGDLKRVNGASVDTRVAIKKTYYAIIPFLFLTVLWTYLDRSNLAFSALSFKQYLHLNNYEYGLGSGIFFLGYVVTMLPANLLILRVGAPNLLAFIVCAWGIVGAATAAVRNVWQFYLLRFLLGLAEGGTFPGTFYHASLFFSTKELNLGFAAVTTATAISQVVGALAAAALLQMDGVAGMPGWQWLFIIEGLLTVVYGICVKLLLAPKPSTAWFLQPAEREWLQQRQDNVHAGAVATSGGRGSTILAGLISWRLWYLGVVWFLVETTIFGVLFWAPLILDAMLSGNFSGTNPKAATPAHQTNAELTWHTTKLALISCALYVPVSIVMILVAWSSKKYKERHLHGGIPVFISGVAFLIMPIVLEKGGPIPGIIMLIIAGCGAWSLWGPIWSWPATFLLGKARASGSALFNTLGVFGGFVGPYLIGALSNHGSFTRPMYVLGAFNVVAAFMMFIFRAPDYVDESIDDYAEDHSHVGDRSYTGERSNTPLHAGGPNGAATAVNGIPVGTKQ